MQPKSYGISKGFPLLSAGTAGPAPPPPLALTFDYFARDGATYPWYVATTPNAVYDATGNKTWVVYERWDGLERCEALRIYDHATNLWGPTYDLFRSTAVDNDHGVPSLCFDAQGHVHVFGGAHAMACLWYSTTTPRDPTTFVKRARIGGDGGDAYTYPHPIVMGSTIYLFMRDNSGVGFPLVLRRITGLNNGNGAVSSETTIAQLADKRCYIGWCLVDGTKITVPVFGSNIPDSERRDVSLVVYDTADGSVKNHAGTVSVASGSLPVTLGSDYLIRDQTSAGTFGGFASVEYDAAGRLHMVYREGSSAQGSRLLYHTYYSGGAWTTPVLVGTLGNLNNGTALKKLSDGSLLLLYAQSDVSVRGGPIYKQTFTIGGGWTPPVLVMAQGLRRLDQPNPVLNGLDSFSMVFAETSIPIATGATLNDTRLGCNLKAYGYGSGGTVSPVATAPTITGAVVTGTAVVGRVLTASAVVKGDPEPNLSYQWRRNSAPISGQTNMLYTAVSEDVGTTIDCVITATSIVSSASATATGKVILASISGMSVKQIVEPVVLMHIDASQTSDLTLSGANVTQWLDRSGKGNHLTVASGSTSPDYSATGWNGSLPCVSFDGAISGDMLQANGPLHSYLTIYTAMERTAGVNDSNLYLPERPLMAVQAAPFDAISSTSSSQVTISLTQPSTDPAQSKTTMAAPYGTNVSTTGLTVGTKVLLRNRIRPTASRFFGIKIGSAAEVLSGENLLINGAGETTLNRFFLGGDDFNIGTRASFKIAEMLIIYGNPTDEQDADIRTLLAAKWGVTV